MSWPAPDDSFFWSSIREFRSSDGKDIVASERAMCEHMGVSAEDILRHVDEHGWTHSPKPQWEVELMLGFLAQFQEKDSEFTYLEFGTCFGTTFSLVMSFFENAKGIAIEVDPNRFEVSRWMINRIGETIGFQDRVKFECASILDAKLEPNSIDVVFMDTNHRLLDDYEFVMHLVNSGALKEGFLFVGDDPTHSGTDQSRKRFMENHSAQFHIVTREDLNLWWFKERAFVGE